MAAKKTAAKTKKSTQASTSTMKPGAHTRQEVARIMQRDAEMGRMEHPTKKQINKMMRG